MTPRQQQVLVYVQKGLSNKLIARELKISEATVKAYVSALLIFHEVQTRYELIALAMIKKEWVGLTDEEYEAMAEQYVTNCYFDTLKYAQAIEAKLKGKNDV